LTGWNPDNILAARKRSPEHAREIVKSEFSSPLEYETGGSCGRRNALKKQVSPVVTVVVILVVVVIVALLWNHFGNPPRQTTGRGGFGGLGKVDISKLKPEDLEKIRAKAQEAKQRLIEQAKGSAAKAGGAAGE
jgi:hypothetical protein